jgi:predicted transcriptional regulator
MQPLSNPAEEAIMVVIRAAAEPLTAREIWREVERTRPLELSRTWELLWAMADKRLIQTRMDRAARRWYA